MKISAVAATALFFRSHCNALLWPSPMALRAIPTKTQNLKLFSSMSSPEKIPLIDVDCNLLHPDLLSVYNNDTQAILSHESTKSSGIIGIVSPSSTIQESHESIRVLSAQTSQIAVKTTVGVHPYHAHTDGHPEDYMPHLKEIALNNKNSVACIGECGLDYSAGFPPPEVQKPWFDAQLDLAFENSLPLFLHERSAFEDTLTAIDDAAKRCSSPPSSKILIHCFTGIPSECREYIERGYYISLSGYILKKGEGPEAVRQCLKENLIPLDKLMIETDAPYMGFPSCRDAFLDFVDMNGLNSKKRKQMRQAIFPNVPSSLPLVLRGVLEGLNEGRGGRGEEVMDALELGRVTTRNAIDFFGFDLNS